MPTVENVRAKMTLLRFWWRLHQAAISDDGAANKMAQMGSIFTDGPPLGPPPHHIRGDEEEKITLKAQSSGYGVCRRVMADPLAAA